MMHNRPAPIGLTRFEALTRVAEFYGTQEKMAAALGINQATVSRMIVQSKQLRHDLVLKAEADTGVSRHDLRPDIYPVETHGIPLRFYGVDRGTARVPFNRGRVSKAAAQ